jgi:acetolactate synthase-1/2/3 large subunit
VPIHVWRGVLWATVIDDLTLVAPLVKSPVLVLWGEKDGFFDLSHQEKLEKAYPDAEFQVFREAGHNMFWEFPDKAARVINEAERPVLYLGGGVISSNAAPEILKLAELRRLPVATTLMALGAFPETHELSMGMLGMHGTVTANYAVHECDLLVNIGARFDDRVTGKLKAFAPHAKVIHADVDPAEIGKNVAPLIPIVGDAKHVAAGLVKELQGMEWSPDQTSEWTARIAQRKDEFPLHYEDPQDGKLAPQLVIQEIDRITGHDAIICTDVGQHQMWATQHYTFTYPRQFVSSGGLGTMGFGLPASIGAKVGNPDKTVIDISGDGGFQMTM